MIGMCAETGRAISGRAHLAQSMADIVATPIGSRVMRRGYGSLVPDLLDHPLNGANILRLYAATAHALMTWEPRVRITRVQLDLSGDGAAMLDLGCIADGKDLQIAIPLKAP